MKDNSDSDSEVNLGPYSDYENSSNDLAKTDTKTADTPSFNKLIKDFFKKKNFNRLESRSQNQENIIRNMMDNLSDIIKEFEDIKSGKWTPKKNTNYSSYMGLKTVNSKDQTHTRKERSASFNVSLTTENKNKEENKTKRPFYLPKVEIEIGSNNVTKRNQKNIKLNNISVSPSKSLCATPRPRYMDRKKNPSSIRNILSQSLKKNAIKPQFNFNKGNKLSQTIRNVTITNIRINKRMNFFSKLLEEEKNKNIIINISKFFEPKKFPFRNVNKLCRKVYLENLLNSVKKKKVSEKDDLLSSIIDEEVYKNKENTLNEFINSL